LGRYASQATDALLRVNQEGEQYHSACDVYRTKHQYLHDPEIMSDVKAIRSALEESASLSKELTRTIDDLRRQLDEQKKRSPMDVAKDTFDRQKKQLMYRTDVESIQAKRLGIRSKGTCTWIFDDKDYRKWYDSPKSDALFIYGDGNMGKSILVSSIIEVLQQKSQESDKILTEYFFCSNGDDHAQKTDRVFDQILYALYKHVPSSLEIMDKCNETVKRYLAKRAREAAVGDKSADEEKPLNFDEAFMRIAVTLKKDVFLVIDALDECMDREKCGLISTILALVSEAETTSQQTRTQIKVIVSGRPHKDITSGLRDVTHQISIRKHNESDIKTYTCAALEDIPDMTQAERVKACDAIVHKADAIFGYVGPALDTFRKPWRRPLEDHLNALPNDHLRMNAQILARIDPSYVEFLKTCLTWTILANGNQKVKIEEVIDAYSRVYVNGSTEWKREKLDEAHIKFYREQIQTAGSSFLEVDTETREISLIKPPIVKESFIKDPQEEKHQEAESQTTCLRCRSHNEARQGFSFTERDGHLQIAQIIRM
jgi:GTPase SAR1 family protein